MKFQMRLNGTGRRNGLPVLLVEFIEMGKRWPYYRGSAVARSKADAMDKFRAFVESARAHRKATVAQR